MKVAWTLLLTFGTVVSGCKQESEAPKQVLAATPASSPRSGPPVTPPQLAAPDKAVALDVTWDPPTAWQPVSIGNSMRKATYRIPRSPGDSDDAELAVSYFGSGLGGSIEANVDRWLRQFSGIKPNSVKREERSVNGLRQHVVRVESATFAAGIPGGPTQPKSDWGLLGAIVETSAGPYFFKLTGPTATLRAAEKAFYALLDSVKTKA